jgi:ADP-L-glycero-D-manno-heptose 6-epimerase
MKQKQIFDDQYIVITGAAGFIGSGVVRYLNDKGLHNLILVDDFKTSIKWKNLVGKQYIDLISRYQIFDWLKGKEDQIEAFIHLGACSDTLEKDGNYLVENNYRFSTRLAEYAINNDHRFIYASSAATYGDGKLGFTDDVSALINLQPLNMYGYSKHMFDLWLYREKLLDKVVGLKYFNVFGPNENHKGRMASMIYKMTEKVLQDGEILLFKSNDPEKYKDGEQLRDFIYVKDAVKMTCDLLEKSFKDVSGIFNIGRGEAVTWNRIAEALFKALGKKPNIKYIPMPEELSKHYQNYTRADMTKTLSLYDGTTKPSFTPIEEAVDEYVNDYLLQDARW